MIIVLKCLSFKTVSYINYELMCWFWVALDEVVIMNIRVPWGMYRDVYEQCLTGFPGDNNTPSPGATEGHVRKLALGASGREAGGGAVLARHSK